MSLQGLLICPEGLLLDLTPVTLKQNESAQSGKKGSRYLYLDGAKTI